MPIVPINQEYSFTFSHMPLSMKGGHQMLLVIKNNDGKYLLSSKRIYPNGIVRFLGREVQPKETAQQVAIEIVSKELKLPIKPVDLIHLATVTCHIEDPVGIVDFITDILFLEIQESILSHLHDSPQIVWYDSKEMKAMVRNYKKLSKKPIEISRAPRQVFRWSDYGKLYSTLHQIGLELTSK